MSIYTDYSIGKPPEGEPVDEVQAQFPYWTLSEQELFTRLESSKDGLQPPAAERLLKTVGLNTIQAKQQTTALKLLLSQFKSPLVLILISAAIISGIVHEWMDAGIILAIVFGSTILGFVQEYTASNAVEKLRSQVTIKSNLVRGGNKVTLASEQVLPGDIVLLSAGSLIPADGVVLEANDFFVNQAVLTGETFPVEKISGILPLKASLSQRTNCVYMGTSVSSGSATALIAQTGKNTVFGQVAEKLSLAAPETEFERGIRQFSTLLTQVMLVIVLIVLGINIFLAKPAIDSLLFALALAVGLTPELLPAIISITLSFGAQQMAKRGVIVRRLAAIENFGSMDILCTDKTGTLTEGLVHLDSTLDAQGKPSTEVLRYAYYNAHLQTGLTNSLDDAIELEANKAKLSISDVKKIDEIPYDFVRKCLSVVVSTDKNETTLITKGALSNILAICETIQVDAKLIPLDKKGKAQIDKVYSDWSEKGYRVLGLAIKEVKDTKTSYSKVDEKGLSFLGFLLFFDPPKADAAQVIQDLIKRGVSLKIITGDNQKVALHVAQAVNLPIQGILTGSQLNELNDEALWHLAEKTTVFSEVDPNQKERIILALKKTSHVVGYMGDGINDAPALHAADVSLSVDTAVDVAKAAADFVLMKKDLSILREGIDEGRITFANTLKYVLTTISANFGNMFSMAGASILLPFLPLLAPQILLNNFLSDIPAVTIASDNVDIETVEKPRRWNNQFIRNYMILFGLVSSIFDFLTFGTLLYIFRASPEEFRTGWFIESLLTELVIAMVVRTRHLFFRSRPGKLLLISTLVFIAVTLTIPYLPFSSALGFIPLPLSLMATMIGLTALYVIATEVAKKFFYSRIMNANA
jgi:P-type Mg2+ transporter